MSHEAQRAGKFVEPTLVGSRLRAPTKSERYVRRPRLLTLLEELLRSPITLVVAPAGAGKTSLLVDWLSGASLPVAWASLDESDSEGQVWSTIAAALAVAVPALGGPANVRARGPIDSVEALLAAMAGVPSPHRTVLVLDDSPAVEDDGEATGSLALFLRSLPPWLHVVIAARHLPNLPLDRLRSRGAVAEVRFSDLKFSPDEAEAMLSRLVPDLPREALARIAAQSEGWAAGIQLAALVARSRLARREDVLELGETDLLVADFIWHEVLAAERPEVIDVLLDTSVAARLGPGLIPALTDQVDPDQLLNEAAEHGLFVARLDTAGWFEVHALVRQALRAEAERREPGRVAAQHARAARWFDQAGDIRAALEHWLLADDPREALHLLAGKAARLLYDSGSEATIAHTLAKIPPGVAVSGLDAQMEYAWCLLLTDRARFLEAVNQLRATIDAGVRTSAIFLHRLAILESISTMITGDWGTGSRLAARAMEGFGEAGRSDWLGRFGWNMVARGAALSECWDDFLPDVRRARVALSPDPARRLVFETTRALGHALAGRPAKALEIAKRSLADDPFPDRSILRAERSVTEAICYWELADRSRAEAALLPLTEAPIGPVTYVHVLAQFEMTKARLDVGAIPAARHAFDGLALTVRTEFGGSGGRDLLARAGTLVTLAEGETENAQRWAASVEQPFWQAVCLARVRLAEDDRASARDLLDLAVPQSPRQEVIRYALLARAADSLDEAAKSLIQVVERASATGLLQTVASEGDDVVDMLERLAWVASKSWLDRLRRAASRTDAGQAPVVPRDLELTARELEILRMLPSRLTVAEIARELFISVNTVKYHLRMIYRKLGVGSRDEASQVGRAMRSLRGLG